MKLFREINPKRTCSKKYANYREYKTYLANDFNHRCGYTDCHDFWFGGKDNFHIDHFIPWKKNPERPELKTDYSNLVYCCSYVNIAKSNDESPLYLDPVNVDYNSHFQRDDEGAIIAVSENAKYMYEKMNLNLERYKIIWMLDQLKTKMDLLQKKSGFTRKNNKMEIYRLWTDYNKYCGYLNNLNE